MAMFRLTVMAVSGAAWMVLGATASAGELDQWRVDATNRLQTEHYDNSGNAAASPYPEEGRQTYDELSVNLNRRYSPFERMNVSLSGVANDSAYRGQYQGGNLERARVFWEKGNGSVPLRLEGGDIYAYQTTRTIQTSLKGGQAEFQPDLGASDHSIQVFAGQQAATYRDFDGTQPTFAGGSWLMESARFGALSLNATHGRQEPLNQKARDQQVASVAHAIPFSLWAQELQLESELAYLQGDVAGERKKDQGYYGELSGRSRDLPLSYRASYSLYGEHYQPFGAAVSADRRAVETSGTWRFQNGRFLRARLLDYRDNVEAGNTTDTRTTGLTYGGPLLDWGPVRAFGNIDGFVTESEDEAGNRHTRDATLNANVTLPVTQRVSTRVGLLGQVREDRLVPRTTEYLRQVSAAVDYRFQLAGLTGSISPGLLYRERAGDNQDSRDLNPTLNGSLRRGDHALRFAYNSLRQEVWEPGRSDVLTQQASLQYDYQYHQHRLGVEGRYYDRQPEGMGDTYASRIGVFWEYRFSRAPSATSKSRPQPAAPDTAVGVTGFEPGIARAEVTDGLQGRGLGAPRGEGDLIVYDTPVLDDIQRRQQLVYEFRGNALQSTNLIIGFDGIGDGQSARRVFNEILGNLVLQYGAPDVQINQGAFGPDLSRRLATGQFARTYQWDLDGRLLRFGIPSRIDGVVRMELRYANELPPAEQNDWSLQALP
ncbi:hypothetical protein C8D92_103245 [Tamilnaduibacter salinus]|uniref:Uncharacterized protein n=1 Tax=Tamilnaduibacter salinus TaxID=1484056 RepID=A0A2U1CYJ0_9GAMM|nr:hypothetical protein [Tamilnaduibacter salinus]PVY77558.1 hypothetical protein C8D92_103245 [Tamilnaduibacter salinus]